MYARLNETKKKKTRRMYKRLKEKSMFMEFVFMLSYTPPPIKRVT